MGSIRSIVSFISKIKMAWLCPGEYRTAARVEERRRKIKGQWKEKLLRKDAAYINNVANLLFIATLQCRPTGNSPGLSRLSFIVWSEEALELYQG